MNIILRDEFLGVWSEFFPGAELPVAFWYTSETNGVPISKPSGNWSCLIGELAKARNGATLAFEDMVLGCGGAKRYLGFSDGLHPKFEYFLSCGIPGEMEGERYKKDPETVMELMRNQPHFSAPAKYIVFKRADALTEKDEPLAFVFFATPDVMSGLFTLSGYDEATHESVIAPFSAGCGAIIFWAMHELLRENPRSIIGMFDVSARPCVPENTLTFTVPMPRFTRMVKNARESFLITESWDKVRSRIRKANERG